MISVLAHVISLTQIIDLIVHALHLHGVRHLNVDSSGRHLAYVETHHWLITIRWKG